MIRPDSFAQFSGQPGVTEPLKLAIRSAIAREDVCPHVLLSGPPGLGKTTLARIVAAELGVQLLQVHGPRLKDPNDLSGIMGQLQRGHVLFIDEVHGLKRTVMECLYQAIEDFRMDIIVGEGQEARAINIQLPPFCCIGATTDPDRLTGPMRDRFTLKLTLEPYPVEDLERVITYAAGKLGAEIDGEAIRLIAEHSRGVPRRAINLLRTCRDYAVDKGLRVINGFAAEMALQVNQIGPRGLEPLDVQILHTLYEREEPTGIDALAGLMQQPARTLKTVHEPYLLRLGLVELTREGRIITDKGREYVDQFSEVTT